MTTIVLPAIAAFLVFVRTTWLAEFTLWGAQPDLALLVIIVYAHRHGIQKGQVAGFLVGLLHDALSVSPIGFYAVLGLATGVISGATKEAFRTDSILAPPMLALAVMVIRSIVAILLSLILGLPEVRSAVFSISHLAEIGMNVLLSPFVFLATEPLIRRLDRRGGGF